jgi:capsular polysaccharide export protein
MAMVCPPGGHVASLEQVFHAAYIDYSHYLDLHTRQPCTLEHAVQQAITVRDQRARIERKIFTAGFSPWKRKAMTPFLKGMAGDPVHARSLEAAAAAAAKAADGDCRASGAAMQRCPPMCRQSGWKMASSARAGLGVNLAMPSSVAIRRRACLL